MNSLVKRYFRQWSSKKYNLASYIKIEQGQIFFDLDKQALQKIHQARIRDCSIYLPCSLRILLLRHALLHIGVITPERRKKANSYLLPGLAFYTCYSDDQEDQVFDHTYFTPSIAKKKKLLRSLISPDGDVLNQICSSSLQHPYFLEISATHHWLTTQLLNHLHSNLDWIPQLLCIFSTVVTLALASQSRWDITVKILFIISPGILMVLWIWWRPSIIQWTLVRILSFLEKY